MKQLCTASLFILTALPAWAGSFNLIGFGAHNQSMANSTVALPTDAFSQQYNPALMTEQEGVQLAVGLEGAYTSFNPINQVIVDTPTQGATGIMVADVPLKTPDTTLATIAIQGALSRKAKHPLHLGLNLTAPVQHVMSVNTEDPYVPQYSMYLSDTQKLTTGFSAALAVSDSFALGVGANYYLVQGTTSRVRLPSSANSSAVLKLDVESNLAPTAGILLTLLRTDEETFRIALNYQAKQDYRGKFYFDTMLNVLAPTDLILTGQTSLFFDPDYYTVGTSFRKGRNTFTFAAVWERWSDYYGSAIYLNFLTFQGSYSQTLPNSRFHDVISLHTGYETKITDRTSIRAGYAFVPTPVPDQSGDINYVDSDKHEGFLGVGFKTNFLDVILDNPLRFDACAFAQYLVPKTVTKVSSQSVGYPGYKIEGTVLGYGLTATADF